MESGANLPLVVICGRTNVGKSTLFNCLIEKNQALVSDIAGTTRDSNLNQVTWNHQTFTLVDTAGLLDWRSLSGKKNKDKDIDSQTQAQARAYLDRADLIIFLTDAKAGLLSEDRDLGAALKKNLAYRAKTITVANKVDNFKLAGEAAPFNKLGLGEPRVISAASGLGTGDLLDEIVIYLKEHKTNGRKAAETKDGDGMPTESKPINVCLIGRPNVGKSSLLNAILGYDRVIVSPVPHTTREPQNTEIIYKDRLIKLVDTAGISQHGQKSRGLEKPGIIKSLKSLDKADIALLVLDLNEVLAHQDAKLVQEIFDRRKSLIIIANKWDLIPDRDTKKWTKVVFDKLPFATWASLLFLSAKTGEKVNKILDLILAIDEGRKLTLSDSQANKFLMYAVKVHRPSRGKGLKMPHIFEFRQVKSNPPAFICRIGANDDLHFSYTRFLENRLRERYGFTGTPINIRITKNKKSHTTYNQ